MQNKMRQKLNVDPHDKSPMSLEEENSLNFELLNDVHKIGGDDEETQKIKEIVFLESLDEVTV